MKVIMIKKYNKYNVDEIVEVSDGFGSNFLIKNGYALPVNETTQKNLKIKKQQQEEQRALDRQEAIKLKDKIEEIELEFSLTTTTNNVIHGSISSKKVLQQLQEKGFKIDKHSLPHVSITSLGITKIPVKLFEDVVATLKVNVKGDYGK